MVQRIQKSNAENVTERLNKLKSLGVFIKTYNMAHLLVTRYTVKEDLGMQKGIERLDASETNLKNLKTIVNKKKIEIKEKSESKEKTESKEETKKKEEAQKEFEELKKKLGEERDNYKETIRDIKMNIGTEMLSRFMQGFVGGSTNEEKEKEEQTQFLFKKLHF